jgi:hypothetical protein
MGLPQRDALRHTYADYRTWSETVRYELLDGIAIHELRGHTAVAAVPGLAIDWDRVQAQLGPV